MDAFWNDLGGALLDPVRPRLAHCQAVAAKRAAVERAAVGERMRRVQECEARIEMARASVFAAADGVVKVNMTDLEREWRALSAEVRKTEASVTALWNTLAPARWKDLPRWERLTTDVAWQVAIALAADPEGVERAEACVVEFSRVLAAWGRPASPSLRWCLAENLPSRCLAEGWFHGPVEACRAALLATHGKASVVLRAERLREAVFSTIQRASAFATPALASDVAHVALADFLWKACVAEDLAVPDGHRHAGCKFSALEIPTAPLLRLWSQGYVLLSCDEDGSSLGVRP